MIKWIPKSKNVHEGITSRGELVRVTRTRSFVGARFTLRVRRSGQWVILDESVRASTMKELAEDV